MFTITHTPRFYEIEFSYNPYVIEQVKSIKGSRWYPVKKAWLVPVEQKDAVDRLLKRYGVKKAIQKPQEFGIIPPLPDLTVDIPLRRPMFPFQAKGVAQSLIFKRFINGDDPGLGKTTEAIATVIAEDAFPCLVVCPSSLKINWQREWEIVAGIKSLILSDRVKTTWQQYYKVGFIKVFIVNYESLKKYFVESIDKEEGAPLRLNHISFKENISVFKSVIGDELHRCKNGKTLQTKLMIGITRGKEHIMGLTGTPVVNKPKDLVSQLAIINRLRDVVAHIPYPIGKTGKQTDFSGYKRFMDRYCGGDGTGAENLEELNYKLSTTCFFRRQKKEVLAELPDKIRQIVYCNITTRKEYNEALKDLGDYLIKWKNKTDAEVEKSLRGEIMVRIGICKNISARGKMNEVTEHIDDVLESGQKFGIFIHQKEITARLKEHYPHAVTITGDDSTEARQQSVDSFQNDANTNLIICSIKAAGVGITLTAASRMGFQELPWHPADSDQCEDRFHRIGTKYSVQCTYFLGKDTIDEHIYKIIEEKRKVANTITGSVDDVQREIIDRLADSLFSEKSDAEQENENVMKEMLTKTY